jgi:hypothetical protein
MAGCNGKPDSAPLPVDPRTLVTRPSMRIPTQRSSSTHSSVDLHNPPPPFLKRKPPGQRPAASFAASAQRGRGNLESRQYFQPMALAASYHFIYMQWGYLVRPPDFDEQVAKRYGLYLRHSAIPIRCRARIRIRPWRQRSVATRLDPRQGRSGQVDRSHRRFLLGVSRFAAGHDE